MNEIKTNTNCRVCGSENLSIAIDLGTQSLTGVFLKNGASVDKFNISLSTCEDCGLLQINEVYDLDLLYGDGYGYESSLNASMVEHLKLKAESLKKLISLKADDVVIDIGSNDATTLGFFDDSLVKIGVDISGSKFVEKYKENKSTLIADFFPTEKLSPILKGKEAKIVSSYSCFYDLPDPVYFAKEISRILANNGVWCLEQSYLPSMLDTNSFDTICHEHIEYYKLQDIKNICDQAGLEIKDIEFNAINGGSFSVLVGHQNDTITVNPSVKCILDKEKKTDWKIEISNFNLRISELKTETLKKLEDLKSNGKRVAGIGASTKGNVLLQYYGIDSNLIESIGEVNPNKYGCETPGTGIPILSQKELLKTKPDYLFILPWHFRDFFISNEEFRNFSLIFPLPNLEIIK